MRIVNYNNDQLIQRIHIKAFKVYHLHSTVVELLLSWCILSMRTLPL